MSDGYQVDPEAMERITRGINQAMAELKEFGFDIEANLGRGFDDLSMTGLEVGDDGLQQVFGDFCDRWGWGVRSLMRDANEFAGRLGLSAGNSTFPSDRANGAAMPVRDPPAPNARSAADRLPPRSVRPRHVGCRDRRRGRQACPGRERRTHGGRRAGSRAT